MRILALLVGFIVGLLPGIFIIGASLFSDGPAGLLHGERLFTYALAGGLYAVFGAILGAVFSDQLRWSTIGLIIPGALVDLLLAIAERPTLSASPFYLVYLLILIVGSISGGRAGRKLAALRRLRAT